MNEICYDNLGPVRISHLYDPEIPFHAFVVIDNTARGPSLGGVRITHDVTPEEVARLARTMTFKSAAAGLYLGGGKSGIVADPQHPRIEEIVRRFARMIARMDDYIPAPDMGSNETMMAWIKEEIGRVAGLPEELGGLPLDKLGATGYGLSVCAEVACQQIGLPLNGARIAIQGFGNVGSAAARFLADQGAVLVALSDREGTAWSGQGLDLPAALKAHDQGGDMVAAAGGDRLPQEAIFGIDCDILIPAATPDVIRADNQGQIHARMLLEGANIPATREAEQLLAERGVLVVPDFIANAGGLIMAAAEYYGKTEQEAFDEIRTNLHHNTSEILQHSRRESILPRQAAEDIALARVLEAMRRPPRPRPLRLIEQAADRLLG